MNETQQFTISPDQAGQRLDIFCARHLPTYSRAALQRAIKTGHIQVNNNPAKPGYLVKENDLVVVLPLLTKERAGVRSSSPATPISLAILYEDEDIVVVNKPAGLLAHAPDHSPHQPSVASWFATRYPGRQDVGEDSSRPGIVHRLDKDTSGTLALAKTPEAYQHLKNQFKRHTIKKEYLALVFGVPGSPDGRITRPLTRSRQNPSRRTAVPKGLPLKKARTISSRPAITEWRLEKKLGKYSLLRVFPFTGRTHQIRVHLHHIGHPIVGDPLYTFKRQGLPTNIPSPKGQLLHAENLTLRLLSGKTKTMTAPLPENFQATLTALSQ